jgi:hypothetical protein
MVFNGIKMHLVACLNFYANWNDKMYKGYEKPFDKIVFTYRFPISKEKNE